MDSRGLSNIGVIFDQDSPGADTCREKIVEVLRSRGLTNRASDWKVWRVRNGRLEGLRTDETPDFPTIRNACRIGRRNFYIGPISKRLRWAEIHPLPPFYAPEYVNEDVLWDGWESDDANETEDESDEASEIEQEGMFKLTNVKSKTVSLTSGVSQKSTGPPWPATLHLILHKPS